MTIVLLPNYQDSEYLRIVSHNNNYFYEMVKYAQKYQNMSLPSTDYILDFIVLVN